MIRRQQAALLLLSIFLLLLTACTASAQPGAEGTTGEAVIEEPTEEVVEEPTQEVVEEPTQEAVEEVIEEPTQEVVEEVAAAGGELPEVDPLAVSGDIVIAGSSTVHPLTEAMAERFEDEGYGDSITIDSIGSGAGFERFCVSAETDIANASRPIKEEEAQACRENGREPLEFRVGTDALAIVVSRENDFVDNLTKEQLAAIFSGEAATWADVNPDWPTEAIQLFSPGSDSGTFDYFVEEIFDEDPARILAAPGIQLSEDDNVLVQGVLGSPYAIGYFGYAYYQENEEQLRTISIEGVEPTAETAESNEYPLSRPLFIYSAPSIMQEKPQVADFINFYLTYVNEEIERAGYFPASAAALEEARQRWLEAQQ